MRRRDFIAAVAGAAIAWLRASDAQQPKMRTIGVLVRAAPGWQRFWKAFPAALRDIGYIEGQNIRTALLRRRYRPEANYSLRCRLRRLTARFRPM
jgi:hypothetical protein